MPIVNNVAPPTVAPIRMAQAAKPAAPAVTPAAPAAKPAAPVVTAPAAGVAAPVAKAAAAANQTATVDAGNNVALLIQALTKKATTASELYKKAKAAAAGLASKMKAHQDYMTNGLKQITAQVNANQKESLALSAEINKDASLPATAAPAATVAAPAAKAAAPAAKPAAPAAKKVRRLLGAIKQSNTAASYLVSAEEVAKMRRLVTAIKNEVKAQKIKPLSAFFPAAPAQQKRVLQKATVKANVKTSPAVLKAAAKKVDGVLKAAKTIVAKDAAKKPSAKS